MHYFCMKRGFFGNATIKIIVRPISENKIRKKLPTTVYSYKELNETICM